MHKVSGDVRGLLWRQAALVAMVLLMTPLLSQAQQYDLLISGGHVIDPKNGINSQMDVAVAKGVIAKVAAEIPDSEARQVVDATGYYVTPGLIDPHAHVYVGSTLGSFAGGFSSVSPDDFTFRNGITTVVDPGNSGWRNFPDFKEKVIEPSRTRVLAFLNIYGAGLTDGRGTESQDDLDIENTYSMVEQYPDIIVGTRVGHYLGDSWEPLDKAIEVAERADTPFFLECHLPQLPLREVLERMRPGDIFTHAFGDVRDRASILDENGRVHEYVFEARNRGILFDVGHGGGSFHFHIAIPALEQGLAPDMFGTDLHRSSMNAGMKDMLNIMSKYLNMGMSVEEIIRGATWNSAKSVNREDLGHLSEGAVADLTILNIKRGSYGFIDSGGYRLEGDKKFEAELTLREGEIVWDLNGLTAPLWDQ